MVASAACLGIIKPKGGIWQSRDNITTLTRGLGEDGDYVREQISQSGFHARVSRVLGARRQAAIHLGAV